MKRLISNLLILAAIALSVNSCAVVGLALSTASLVGQSALLAHSLNTVVGSHKTSYAFELVEMTNDGGFGGGEIVSPVADSQTKAEFRDDLIDFQFHYKHNCLIVGFKGQTSSYLTINWNDIVMEGSQKLLWKDGNSSMSTISKAGFNEANLYVIYDTASSTYRTLPLYTSQKKADEGGLAGQTFTLTFPIIQVDKVITYTAKLKITSITVN